jgi:HK97 family phage portal protein
MRGLMAAIAGKDATATSTDTDGWFHNWATGGNVSTAGVSVTVESAMQLSAVWACVRVRSDDIAKLPCILYRRAKDGSKQRAVDHSLYSLIRERPNPRQTAFEFRQTMQANKDLRGNAYAIKEFDTRGRIVALWPLNPVWVTVLQTRDGHELFYRIAAPGLPIETLPAEAIVHLRGLSLDGKVGLSPISYHRETIGLAIAAQQYGAAFFGNSAQPQGGLKVPHVLDKANGDLLRASWEQRFKGAKNAKQLAIFDGGMDWVQTGMDNTDAQYLETRKFQNQQIYALYRMPPHKVGDMERATFSNIEQQALEYVTDCLMSEIVGWEQTLARDLLTDKEREEYYFELLADALLRGDLKSRYEAYAIARNWGWMSANMILDRENMNRIANGDVFLQPLNMIEAGTKPPPVSAPSPGAAKQLIAMLQHIVAADEAAPHKLNGHGSGNLEMQE